MDPNANLEEQRGIIACIQAGMYTADDVSRLADLAEALDEWLKRGGFLPRDWRAPMVVERAPAGAEDDAVGSLEGP